MLISLEESDRRWLEQRAQETLPDAFQAAVARQQGLKLAVRNTKDFPPARFAFVVPYDVR